jgi:predicted phage gp36 major capsid-like protein
MTMTEEAAPGFDPGSAEGEGDALGEIRSAIQGFTSTADQRFGTIEAGLTELRTRLDRTETVLRRPGAAADNRSVAELETRAFTAFIRRGREALSADEIRSLRVSDYTAGGYLAPDQSSPSCCATWCCSRPSVPWRG